ncbi:type I secretion system permease/ATPase [Telmatospirillum siberiense]|uniref:Type I secretion system permease/ATPase n=1 Tax=Telmatospirillum siberiense TaxID=382514 RepID=A0A2N3PV17_9PROT|nr:type I secretion system permease/ATPase [Telmatospirillum siberiense]PKU24234.1 type I secretion system permease/ATPase [Telmatospirillum siberiense]
MPDGQKIPGEIVDTGLSCLVLLLRYFNIAADPAQIRHDYGKTDGLLEAGDLIRCAKRAGALARLAVSRWERLGRAPLPAIAVLNDGSFIVFARFVTNTDKGDRILIQDPRFPTPELKERDEICADWNGQLIYLTHREALAGPARSFDLSWFIPAIIRYRRLFGEVLAASFFVQVMGLVSPLFFQVVTDKVLVHRGLSSLDVLAVGLALVSVFEALLGAARSYVFSHTASRVDVELGAQLFHHLMGLPLSYFGARRAGTTVARVRELENIRNFLTGSALTLLVDAVFTVVFFAVMFAYSATLAWIVLATIPLYAGLSLAVTPLLKRRIDQKFHHGAASQAFLVETVGAAETCKAMAVEPQMQRKWEGLLAAYVRAGFRAQNLNTLASQAAQGISKAQMVLCLWFGAKAVMDGEMTIGALVAFNMMAGRVASPILRLAQLWQDFQQMRVSVDRLGDILNTPTERSVACRSSLPSLLGRVTFDQVIFRYRPDGLPVLKDLSLDVGPGESIGLVGSSGSGKSTLTKLVQRLYLPEAGKVLIDGVDLALLDPAWLRRQVGVVLQENVLFSCSIRDNIALANPGAPMEAVVEAARLATAHDFILELPEAYDTPVVERGANLSGGQRQRIAIARALITNPRILIFDEATSALDYESESEIRRNMRAIARGRTVFIIAHRLSAVRHCDRIVVLEKGRIVEQGSHDALLISNGRYSQLWHCQESGDVMA